MNFEAGKADGIKLGKTVGVKVGKVKGIKIGRTEAMTETMIDLLIQKFGK